MRGPVISDENWEEFEPIEARVTATDLCVLLANGMTVTTPLWWYPTLIRANDKDRNTIELSPSGVHWPNLDEDLSVEGMLAGHRYATAKPPAEAAE